MALENKIEMVADLIEAAKKFFVDLFRPDMTLEKISEVVSPRLDDMIKKYEERGLEYSAGKFHIKYADEKHFQLEFEMYFRDEEGKWHVSSNKSDLRDYTLLEAGAWKTIKALKVITFPIEKAQSKGDEVLQKDKNLEEYREAQALPATEPAPAISADAPELNKPEENTLDLDFDKKPDAIDVNKK